MRTPVAIALDKSNAPVVVCDDGTVFFWGPDPDALKAVPEKERMLVDLGQKMVRHCWLEFHAPVPGTRAEST